MQKHQTSVRTDNLMQWWCHFSVTKWHCCPWFPIYVACHLSMLLNILWLRLCSQINWNVLRIHWFCRLQSHCKCLQPKGGVRWQLSFKLCLHYDLTLFQYIFKTRNKKTDRVSTKGTRRISDKEVFRVRRSICCSQLHLSNLTPQFIRYWRQKFWIEMNANDRRRFCLKQLENLTYPKTQVSYMYAH